MTKGELLVECIKLMFGNDEKLDADCISANEDYSEYTNNIIGSINRALQREQDLGKIPFKTIEIDYDVEPTKKLKNGYFEYDLTSNSDDFNSIISIQLIDKYYFYSTNVPIRTTSRGKLLLVAPEEQELYLVKYNPTIQLITPEMNDTDTLPYPDILYRYIPYFVKADRYEEENPNVANLHRNIFEQYIAGIDIDEQKETDVGMFYKM